MKCSVCGYDDLGTGDSAHVCGTAAFMRGAPQCTGVAPTLEAERAAPQLLPCPECQNEYLAIRTDIYEDKREFVYCDCCGCIAVRSVWNAIRRTAAPVAEDVALPPKQTIDTPDFRALLRAHAKASEERFSRGDQAAIQAERNARDSLIAYIDGRAAGTTPAWDAVALAVDEAEKHGLNYVTTNLLRKLLVKTRATKETA